MLVELSTSLPELMVEVIETPAGRSSSTFAKEVLALI